MKVTVKIVNVTTPTWNTFLSLKKRISDDVQIVLRENKALVLYDKLKHPK